MEFVHGVDSYFPVPHTSVQLTVTLPQGQYEFSGQDAQTRSDEFLHGVVSYMPTEHRALHGVHTVSVTLVHSTVLYVSFPVHVLQFVQPVLMVWAH